MRLLLLLAVPLAGCERPPVTDDTPGGRLEAAAVARGLVTDVAKAGLTGLWANDTDRLCIVPAGKALRLGASVDYGDGQGCAAAGVAERRGDRLSVRFGDCRFDAPVAGERILFPAALPAACARLCEGRASLAALAVERISDAQSEAATLRAPRGRLLCAG